MWIFIAAKNKAEPGYHSSAHELTFHGIVYGNSLLLLHYVIWIALAHRNTHQNEDVEDVVPLNYLW